MDFTSMWRRWLERTDHYHLDGFAMSLGGHGRSEGARVRMDRQ
jgi:hypothetical protein